MSVSFRPWCLASACLLAAALTACGDSADDAAQVPTVTVVEKVQAPPAEETQSPEASSDEEPVAAETDTAPAGKIRVPDVVGEDHQLAQDTMQAAGLYNLAEEDASGAGRMLIYDRNWTVVSQSPAPGSLVPEDRTITLRAKKDGE